MVEKVNVEAVMAIYMDILGTRWKEFGYEIFICSRKVVVSAANIKGNIRAYAAKVLYRYINEVRLKTSTLSTTGFESESSSVDTELSRLLKLDIYNTLGHDYYELAKLYHVEGLSLRDISRHTGLGLQVIRTKLKKFDTFINEWSKEC